MLRSDGWLRGRALVPLYMEDMVTRSMKSTCVRPGHGYIFESRVRLKHIGGNKDVGAEKRRLYTLWTKQVEDREICRGNSKSIVLKKREVNLSR